MKRFLLTVLFLALATGVGAAAFVWSGAYDISAIAQHTQPVYSLLERTMQHSVRLRARNIVPPPLESPLLLARGAACYREKCVQCHGGPGVAPAEIGLSMQPLPGSLLDAATRWKTRELYWITSQGVKMSGMPAWQHRLTEAELWAVVGFVEKLPQLSPAAYREAMSQARALQCRAEGSAPSGPGDALRGPQALRQNACNGCHVIPGVTGADVHIGPPLAGIASRRLIAGAVANNPAQMVRWLRDPHGIDPESAMPALAVSEQDARDIAAYLETLH